MLACLYIANDSAVHKSQNVIPLPETFLTRWTTENRCSVVTKSARIELLPVSTRLFLNHVLTRTETGFELYGRYGVLYSNTQIDFKILIESNSEPYLLVSLESFFSFQDSFSNWLLGLPFQNFFWTFSPDFHSLHPLWTETMDLFRRDIRRNWFWFLLLYVFVQKIFRITEFWQLCFVSYLAINQ